MTTQASPDDAHAEAVQSGRAEARTLTEILKVDHGQLLQHVLPSAPADLRDAAQEAGSLGILTRMQTIGAALQSHLTHDACVELTRHPSDTVRGWGWFALAAAHRAEKPGALIRIMRPAADDPHFGVREWAWMAIRPALAEQLHASLHALAELTGDPSERIRRFASETLRPRGVWAKRIDTLKTDPDLGLVILEPLRSDPSRYVQDSVANWINDASKTRPDWAIALAERWRLESPTPPTERIVSRGLRSLRRHSGD
ncbi:DNA alkylation repair protein [Gulosibacter molinativorax]|uniref:DNA alkylation repair protein n=1 Tax=Gulosibacter molinativorax TaxID=256821 RepID=A0ABT7C579_9MICO|nr:DNA alkylation repair protein [Gulosibacter molinativorax]MDJ1370258.1 DNA alkylation repair protein [Gulosibacter molinativorax]QUY61674.1 Phosphomethylpyrimidine kinase [Gulosibacter molinativorax]